LFKDIGIPGDPAAGDAISIGSAPGDIVDNFNVFNNTIIAGSLASPDAGVSSWHGGTFTNCSIKNNIIIGFDIPIIFISADINTISVENNLFYANNSDAPAYLNYSVDKQSFIRVIFGFKVASRITCYWQRVKNYRLVY
jgi:hypothetical protein